MTPRLTRMILQTQLKLRLLAAVETTGESSIDHYGNPINDALDSYLGTTVTE